MLISKHISTKEHNDLCQVQALSIPNSRRNIQVNLAQEPQDISEKIDATVTNHLQNNILDALMATSATQDYPQDTMEKSPVRKANAMTTKTDNVQNLTKMIQDLRK